jgi:hypothetical protein
MPRGRKKTLSSCDWVRAYEAREPTARHKATLAVFDVLEDRLADQMDADGIDTLGFAREGIEKVSVDAEGGVHVTFTVSYSFAKPIEELLAGCEDAPAILDLFKRMPGCPVS